MNKAVAGLVEPEVPHTNREMNGEWRTLNLDHLLKDEAQSFWEVAFSEYGDLLLPDERDAIRQTRVALTGFSGWGDVILNALVLSGFGKFHLTTDGHPDQVLDRPISKAMIINPFLEIHPFPEIPNQSPWEHFLEGVDVVVDGGSDGPWSARAPLYQIAREKGLPVIAASPRGFGAEVRVYHSKGARFEDFHWEGQTKRRGSFGLARPIAAGLVTAEAIRLMTGRRRENEPSMFLRFDPIEGHLQRGSLRDAQRSLWWRAARHLFNVKEGAKEGLS